MPSFLTLSLSLLLMPAIASASSCCRDVALPDDYNLNAPPPAPAAAGGNNGTAATVVGVSIFLGSILEVGEGMFS